MGRRHDTRHVRRVTDRVATTTLRAQAPCMKRRALALVVCSLLLATGCTGGSEPSRQGLPLGAGGTLVGLMTQTGGSPYSSGALDPQVTSDTATLELSRCCLFRTLLSYDGEPVNEGGATPQPDLAIGPPVVSADGLTWTFTIKPGIRYAPPLEETVVQSGDFVRSIERALSPASPAVAKANGCLPSDNANARTCGPPARMPFAARPWSRPPG